MSKFYVWATVLTESYADGIVAELVRRGFSVMPLASTGSLYRTTDASALIALQVVAELEGIKKRMSDQSKMMEEMKSVFEERKILWHSLIIRQLDGSCTWDAGNIKLPKEEKPEPTRFDKVGEDKATA